MKLLLVRHAIAEERDDKRWPSDADRPLTQRGMRRFRSAAAGLGTLVPEVDRLLTSPFVRAHQTATILEDVLDWPEAEVRPHLAGGAPLAGAIALPDLAPVAEADPADLHLLGLGPTVDLERLRAIRDAARGPCLFLKDSGYNFNSGST